MTVPAWVKASAVSLGLGGAIGLFAALALVGGECSAWRQDHPKPPPPVAQILPPTPGEIATPSTVLPCVPVKVLQPSGKRLKEIAKETGGLVGAPKSPEVVVPPRFGEIVPPAGAGEPDYPLLLVDGRPYPESPAGGKLWVTLEQDGSANVIAKPNEPEPLPAEKFWSFKPVYEIGGMADLESLLTSETKDWKVWAAVEFGRAGRIRPKLQVDGESRSGEKDLRVWTGAVWRSK